jgi:xanthine dehydrogenase YagS FAD-binding subunit
MINFNYTKVASPEEALELIGSGDGTRLIAGGTDLLPLMKDEIASPVAVVDISGWRDGARIWSDEEGLHIGALAPLSTIASHPEVRTRFEALAEACSLAATPQLRNMGSIGGNLLQQTRCWYYRGQHNCWLKGGDTCFARNGENEYHSIFATEWDASPCVSAHPSDPAVALLALEARLKYLTPSGATEMPIGELFALPTDERRAFNTLPGDAVLTEIAVPAPRGSRSVYRKAMARAAWSFALAGVAIYVKLDASRIEIARVALGGVAPIPMRAGEVEAQLTGAQVDSLNPDPLADLLVANAQPLSRNGYKVPLLRGLFKEALAAIGK